MRLNCVLLHRSKRRLGPAGPRGALINGTTDKTETGFTEFVGSTWFGVFVSWWVISEAWTAPTSSSPEPPRPSASVPASATTGAAPVTATDIAKLKDTIAKLTATVDRLYQQLADRDRPAKPSGSSSSSSPPTSDIARRQAIYARQMWRRSLWREPACSW